VKGVVTTRDLDNPPVAPRLASPTATLLGTSPATNPSDLVAIDLFAGAGGLSQGFRDAGFTIAQAVEKDPNALATYSANHPSTDLVRADIRTLKPADCLRRIRLKPGEATILIGGPPCQGFSESNRRTRTLANPQNHLYREFLRFFRYISPEWLVMENVAGLQTMSNGLILERILASITSAGYEAETRLLNAVHYGVPQVRRRLFVIANRTNADIPTILPRQERPITVREAIADLPHLVNGASVDVVPYRSPPLSQFQRAMRGTAAEWVSSNLVTKNAAFVRQRYRHIPPGGNWKDIPKHLLANYTDPSRCHTGIYHRLSWDRPSKVIGNFRKNMLIHPSDDRGLSVREAARLQGFRDSYEFRGSIGFRQQQVADAVPPLLAAAVAMAVVNQRQQTERRKLLSMPSNDHIGVRQRQARSITHGRTTL
jgi:DNA (cytosine-5)-methyltransferase 1